jgi:membrane-bound serine protease (ClpP class)
VKNRSRSRAVLALLVLSLTFLFTPFCTAATPQVVVLHLNDTIQPISDEYLVRGLKRAEDLHAEATLIELNTPGGLLETTREMVRQILDSSIPVIVYVAPSGSRAGSAG